jgi:purine nucleosidase
LSVRTATELWVDLVREYPGQITGLVTGPLTNLALAIRIEPDLPRLLNRLVVMGGSFNYPGNTTPTAEWNVSVDPHAAKEVFDAFSVVPAHRRPIICGLNVTESIEMFPEHVRRLAEAAGSTPDEIISPDDGPDVRSSASNSVIRHLSDAIRFYMEFHREYDQGFLAHMHDPFAAAIALDPALGTLRPATVDVETESPLLIGTTVADWVGHWKRDPNADIVVSTDPVKFFDELVQRVGRFARAVG